jgi:hypothetical protein
MGSGWEKRFLFQRGESSVQVFHSAGGPILLHVSWRSGRVRGGTIAFGDSTRSHDTFGSGKDTVGEEDGWDWEKSGKLRIYYLI